MRTYRCSRWDWKLGVVSTLAVGGAIAWSNDCAKAQITPDNTLGDESSVVTPNVNINGLPSDRLDGGAVRGANLFHSFQEFNVSEGRGAYFINPAGIENILSRMTGSDPSDILGTLGVLGNANLFLLNPNGIIFGPSSSLDIGGSFVASTASSLNFADGAQFGEQLHQTTPLLTVSIPIGLQYGGTAGSILNQSQALDSSGELVGLQVQPGKTLALVGGNVELMGGNLTAAGGSIELGSVAGKGLVSLTPIDFSWALGYEGVQNFQDIQLSQQSAVSAIDGGDIQVHGRSVTLSDGSRIGNGTMAALGGTLSVTASESVELSGIGADGFPSVLAAQTLGTGAAGDLRIDTGRLIVRDGAQVSTGTFFGNGQGGNLTVTASDFVDLRGTTPDGQFASSLLTLTSSTGAGGDLRINTGQLIVRDGAQVSAGTATDSIGHGGSLVVNASKSVELTGRAVINQAAGGLFVQTNGAGDAGSLRIDTRQLIIRDGAWVSSSTAEGGGSAGNLVVTASDFVKLSGVSADGEQQSLLVSGTQGTGAARDLTIVTRKLIVQDGAQVFTGTLSQGQGGALTVSASDSVELSGISADRQFASGLFTQTQDAGDAGNMRVDTGQLIVRDGAQVSVSSIGTGNAGNLEVTASSIRLDDQASLSADITAGQGNIILNSRDLVLRRGSNITTNATGTASGGNITIDAGALAALEDSDISANAPEGFGGRVIINAQGIFGTEFRNQPTPKSDITASSNLGPQFSGTVEINTPDVDLQNSLSQLSANFVSPDQVVAGSCLARRNVERGSFTVTGTGGLPRSPYEAMSGRYTVTGVQSIQGSSTVSSRAAVVETAPWKRGESIQEAQGMAVTADGRTIVGTTPQLVALAKAQNLVCHSN